MYTEKEREKMGISKDFRGDTKEVMQEQSIAANSEGEYK